MPRLSIVIPVLGRHDVLERVLQGLDRQTAPPDSFEVVVVTDEDDPEGPLAQRLIEHRPYRARALVREAPGVSAARNAGWRAADAPIVLFLGADILPARRLVAEHLAWHERHPEDEAGVLGRVVWARELPRTTFMRWLDRGIQFDYGSIKGEDAGWGGFYTANVSVKKALLELVGGFDEEFPFLYEDLELAYRMSKVGFKLWYNRRAVGEHLHLTTLDDWRARIAQTAPAERAFVARHPGVEPHFHRLFHASSQGGQPLGRRMRASRFVPPWVPVLGPYVWKSVDAYYTYELAPAFLSAWEEAEPG